MPGVCPGFARGVGMLKFRVDRCISTSERNENLAGTIRGLTIAIEVDRDSAL